MNYVKDSLEVSAEEFGTDLGPMAGLRSECAAAIFSSLYVADRGVIYDLAAVNTINHMKYKGYLDRDAEVGTTN